MSARLSKIGIMYKKEMAEYFYSPIAYVFIILFLVVSMPLFFFFLGGIFQEQSATMRSFFMILPLVFIVFIPGLTMGSWATERNTGTIELLFTYPISDWDVLLGKFLAAFTMIIITLAGTLVVPIFAHFRLGNFDLGQLFTQYLGSLLLACTYISITFFISSITRELILSFLISSVTLLVLAVAGMLPNMVQFPGWLNFFKVILIWISTSTHFTSFGKGVIDTRDVLYYAGITLVFLYLTNRSLESRKWS